MNVTAANFTSVDVMAGDEIFPGVLNYMITGG